MTYVGLGSSQFTISPSLSDIQTTVSEMFITPTAAIFEEEHDVTDMHCMDVRDPDPDRMMVVSVVGGNSLVRDLAVTAQSASIFLLGSARTVNGKCYASHYHSESKDWFLGCHTESGEYSRLNVMEAGSPSAPNIQNDYSGKPMKSGAQAQQTKLVRHLTRIPGTASGLTNLNFAFIDEQRDIYFCGSEYLQHDGCTKVVYSRNPKQIIFGNIDYISSTPGTCMGTGQLTGDFNFFAFFFDCSCPEPLLGQEITRGVSGADFVEHYTIERPMAFAISRKSSTSQKVLIYIRKDSVDYIFAKDRLKMVENAPLFPQKAYIFSEETIRLQATTGMDSLVLVLNGSKSVSLINWAQQRMVQQWRSGSENPKVSACIVKDKVVVLEWEPGVRSAIRGYKMNAPSGSCLMAKYCRLNNARLACIPGYKLNSASASDLGSCNLNCPPRKFAFLDESCMYCHRNCKTCSGRLTKLDTTLNSQA